MSKKLLSLMLSGFFVLGLIACDDDDEAQNLVQLVASTPELSTLLTVIQYIDENGSQEDSVDLSALLEIEIAEYTVFAPNNAAFDELDRNTDGVFDSADIAELENGLGGAENVANALYAVVANHVLATSQTTAELEDGEDLITFADLAGNNANFGLVVNLSEQGSVRIVPSDTVSVGVVVSADINASNGVAHIVDSVLLDSTTAGLLNPVE